MAAVGLQPTAPARWLLWDSRSPPCSPAWPSPSVPKHTSAGGHGWVWGDPQAAPGDPWRDGRTMPGDTVMSLPHRSRPRAVHAGEPLQHPGRADGCHVLSFPSYNQAEPHRVSAQSSRANADSTTVPPRLTVETHHQKQRASPKQEHVPVANFHREEEEELSSCAENKAEYYHLYYSLFE